LAPKYARPDQPVPTEWRVEAEEGSEFANNSWWKALGDEALDELIDKALANNRDLQVAIARVLQYFADYEVSRSSLLPQINLNSLAVKEDLPIDEDFLPPGFNKVTPDYRLNLSVSYEIDLWGKLRNTASAAYSEYLGEIQNRRTVVLTLVGSVASAYVSLRQLDAQLEIAKNILESRKESLEIARYRFEGGLTSKIEVDQAESVYEDAVATVANLEKLVPQQENLLSVLIGEPSHEIKRGQPLSKLILPDSVPSGTPVDLLTRRPEILAAENKLIAAHANIGVARAAFFPQVNFAALFGLDSLQLSNLFNKTSNTWSLGGTLLEQVFTGGELSGQLKVAKAKKQELLAVYEQKILEALREVNDALIGLKQTKRVFAADTLQVAALKDYLSLSWDRYYEGQTEYLTVLDAERHVFDAELKMVAAEADQFFALVDLYKSLGGGWVVEADLEAISH
jgi:multidrug efflux system outer membrane protein